MTNPWIKCTERLPEVFYSKKMNYWYSKTVETRNEVIPRIKKRCLMGHTKESVGWGSCLGGQPSEWRE